MMNTFALFDDGSMRQIVVGFLEPFDKPQQTHHINISDPEIINSGKNAYAAAIQVLKVLGYGEERDRIQYQFKEEGQKFYALGGSAGLAFCLKFAQEIYTKQSGRSIGYSIASTGVLSDGTEKAEVTKVEGVGVKLKAAAGYLKKGDKIFYPFENDQEIKSDIRTKAADKGIELIPVSTVRQAIRKLLEKHPTEEYPIEIIGLGEPVSGSAVYQLDRRFFFSSGISVPFKIVNKGNLKIKIETKNQESVADWIRLSLPAVSIPANEELEAKIRIPSHNRFLFFLRHFFKLFFKRQGKLSIGFHIPEQEPYDFTRDIQVKVRFINFWHVALAVLIFSGYAVYINQLHSRILKQLLDRQNKIVSPIPVQSNAKSGELISQLIDQLEQGRYLEVKKQVDNFLNRSSTGDEKIIRLQHQLSRILSLKLNFRYLRSGRKAEGPEESLLPSSKAKVILGSGDSYRLEYTSNDDCFLYIYQLDPIQDIAQLFPNAGFTQTRNPLQGGKSYLIPSEDNWFVLDKNTGKEAIYFVASRWPAKDLEQLFARFNEVGDKKGKDEYRLQLLERIKERGRAHAAGLAGCFYKEFSFRHD